VILCVLNNKRYIWILFFLLVFSHFKSYDLTVITVKYGWNIELTVRTLYLGNICQKLCSGLSALKSRFIILSFSCISVVAFVIVWGVLRLWIKPFSFIVLYTVRRAYIYSFLYKSFMNSFYSIIIVIRMFCEYFFDFDQKKLPVCLSSKIF